MNQNLCQLATNHRNVNVNGPIIGEADETLKKALNLKFGVGKWHFSTKQILFRTSGATVEKRLKEKSKQGIYDK